MTTGGVKNIAVIALVVGAVVFIVLSLGGGPSGSTTASVTAKSPPASVPATTAPAAAPTTAPATTVPPTPVLAAGVSCPAGSAASSGQGSIPTAVATGFMWTPALYPSVGWCEVPG
jgi:hypothetical protein